MCVEDGLRLPSIERTYTHGSTTPQKPPQKKTHREPAVELAALDVVVDHLLDPVQRLLRHLVGRPELRQDLARQPVADLVEGWPFWWVDGLWGLRGEVQVN